MSTCFKEKDVPGMDPFGVNLSTPMLATVVVMVWSLCIAIGTFVLERNSPVSRERTARKCTKANVNSSMGFLAVSMISAS